MRWENREAGPLQKVCLCVGGSGCGGGGVVEELRIFGGIYRIYRS